MARRLLSDSASLAECALRADVGDSFCNAVPRKKHHFGCGRLALTGGSQLWPISRGVAFRHPGASRGLPGRLVNQCVVPSRCEGCKRARAVAACHDVCSVVVSVASSFPPCAHTWGLFHPANLLADQGAWSTEVDPAHFVLRSANGERASRPAAFSPLRQSASRGRFSPRPRSRRRMRPPGGCRRCPWRPVVSQRGSLVSVGPLLSGAPTRPDPRAFDAGNLFGDANQSPLVGLHRCRL